MADEIGDPDPEVISVLEQKGALEILVELGYQDELRHTELREEVQLSSSTLQKRLKAGKEVGIWTQTLAERDGTSVKVYTLTDFGESLYEHTNSLIRGDDEFAELREFYRARRSLNDDIQNIEARIIESVSSTPDEN